MNDPQPLDASRAGSEPAPRHRTPSLALDPPPPAPDHEPEIAPERLDAEAVKVVSRLHHVGHEAYFVGGCVRDLLLGRKPKDFDIATDAHPGEVRAVFRNCRLIGRRFRLAHVYFRGGKIVEVATFRKNPTDVTEDLGEASDLLITRDNVFGTAEEDALRRDFTVNALLYDVFAGKVIDYVGGRADLEAHRIATIGDPEIRMREDPVRALRAIRFASRLGFTIEPETFAAMRRHAGEIARCAPPRVLEEILKILRCGGAARAFELLRASGALTVTLPALAAALDAAADEERRRFQAHLSALDALVRAGEEPSEAVLLGTLVMHLGTPAPGAPGGAEAMLRELVETARLPRRIAERIRLALLAQRHLRGQQRRRRRGRGLARQTYFADALQLLALTVKAGGDGAEDLARWQATGVHHDDEPHDGRADGSGPEVATAPAARSEGAPPGEAGRKRRRRRGGRRRRHRGAGPQQAPPAGAAPA